MGFFIVFGSLGLFSPLLFFGFTQWYKFLRNDKIFYFAMLIGIGLLIMYFFQDQFNISIEDKRVSTGVLIPFFLFSSFKYCDYLFLKKVGIHLTVTSRYHSHYPYNAPKTGFWEGLAGVFILLSAYGFPLLITYFFHNELLWLTQSQ